MGREQRAIGHQAPGPAAAAAAAGGCARGRAPNRTQRLPALALLLALLLLPLQPRSAAAFSLGELAASVRAAVQPAVDAAVAAALPVVEAALERTKAALEAATSKNATETAAASARGGGGASSGDAGEAAARAAFESITGGGGADDSATKPAAAASAAGGSGVGGVPLIRTLSWQPRVMLWSGFMTPEEAEHLRQLGAEHLTKSDVVDSDTGNIVRSKDRTSSGAFLRGRRIDPVITSLEERIARWVQVPLGNGEPFHILRYNPTEEYVAHFDSFFDKVHVQNGGQRLATVILYLSEVEEGGETVFPSSPTRPDAEESAGLSACAKKGLGVRPHKGDALMFFSLKPDGKTQDTASLHAGCPVIKGTKWIATKWIRVGHYYDYGDPLEDGDPPSPAAAAAAAAAERHEDEDEGADGGGGGGGADPEQDAEGGEGGAHEEL